MRVHSLWCSSPDPVGQPMRTVLSGLLAYFLLCSLFYAAAFSYAHMPTSLPSLTTHHSLSQNKTPLEISRSVSYFGFTLLLVRFSDLLFSTFLTDRIYLG